MLSERGATVVQGKASEPQQDERGALQGKLRVESQNLSREQKRWPRWKRLIVNLGRYESNKETY